MLTRLVVAAGVSLGLLGCGGNDTTAVPVTTAAPTPAPAKDIVELAVAEDSLSTLVAALTSAELVDTLKGDGPFTVFAPNNKAFEDLPAGELDRLLKAENKAELVSLLKFHVLPSKTLSGALVTAEVKTVEPLKKLTITKTGDAVTIGTNAAAVLTADVVASNGVVHIISKVLDVPVLDVVELAQNGDDLSTLVSALVAADLVDALKKTDSSFTVFAPNNDAFKALPTGKLDELLKTENKAELVSLLKFHVLPSKTLSTALVTGELETLEPLNKLKITKTGDAVTIGTNAAEVLTADVGASNGVVHIISKVLAVPDVVELAQSVDDLSTLVAALTAAELVDTLKKTDSSFTVFAPNNKAFEDLPEGELDRLLKSENKAELVSLLKFHVLPSKTLSSALVTAEVKTVEPLKKLTITKTDDAVTIGTNAAEVLTADVGASNGVVHIISKVLAVPVLDVVQLAQNGDDLSTLVAALTSAELVDTLKKTDSLFTVFAPNNKAFEALPAGELDRLLKSENKAELVSLLKFHVLPSKTLSGALVTAEVETLEEGKKLQITKTGDAVTIGTNAAAVLTADVDASNGVVHIIDKVLAVPQRLLALV